MSFNLSTMPGCTGEYEYPIEEWLKQGYTCQECAWERYCKEFNDENHPKKHPTNDHTVVQSIRSQTAQIKYT